MDKNEPKSVIKNLHEKDRKTKEIHDDMVKPLREYSPCYSTVQKWVVDFKGGKESTDDDARIGRPKSAATDAKVEGIYPDE